jgi:outer membrane protein with beta-barrel domain
MLSARESDLRILKLCLDRNQKLEERRMRRIVFTVSLLLVLPFSAMGQQAPKAEVFGGFSYFHTEGGGNLYGWNASVAGNLNNWFGLVADFGGHYDSNSSTSTIILPGIPGSTFRLENNMNVHTFMVGPRFSYRKSERITPFGHILIGGMRRHIKSDFQSGSFGRNSFTDTQTTVAGAVGGGLDVNLGKSIALRVVQADFVLTHFFSTPQSNARVSVGLVFRFGGK